MTFLERCQSEDMQLLTSLVMHQPYRNLVISIVCCVQEKPHRIVIRAISLTHHIVYHCFYIAGSGPSRLFVTQEEHSWS